MKKQKYIQKQHTQTGAHKVRLRKTLLPLIGDGAAYVPFIGDGDIAVECYSDRLIYGVDIDPDRVVTASERLPNASVIVGDCEEGWPLGSLADGRLFAVCDSDAYSYPYGAIRAFLSNAKLANRLAIFATDGRLVRIGKRATYGGFYNEIVARPPGEKRFSIRKYHLRNTVPAMEELAKEHGYRIVATRKTMKGFMFYIGQVWERMSG